MKEGWEYRKFESCLLKVPKQVQVKSKEYKTEGKFPIVSQEAELISGYWDDETIVYSHKDPVVIFGDHTKNIKYIDFDFVVGADGTHILSTKNDINPKFFYYVLKSIKLRELGYARHYKLLKEKYIPVPKLSEQQSIVDYLDSAFAKIDAMKANAEKALNEAKALFQVSLKEMLEPKEGWEEKALKDFAIDMYRGSGVKRDQVTEDGIPCVRYGEIYTKYNYHFNECDSHTLAEYVNSPKYFEYGDILFAITGESVEDIGKSIAYTGKDKCIAGGDMVVMKHSYEPRYISYALSTPAAIKQKGRGKTKLKVVHTNIPSLKEIIIPIAPIGDQKHIADTLDSLKSKVDRLQENYDKISQECDALKQAILRQVFE